MDFRQQLQYYASRVNQTLQQQISAFSLQDTPLVNAMHYSCLPGGKRLRPFLVYATGSLFGVPESTLDVPAAAVECIHAYSLIHDDLPAMDNDDLRRGLPSCHKKFGEALAILAGDALQTLAFSILTRTPMPGVSDVSRLEMLAQLAQASGVTGMCGGQALDLQAQGQHIHPDTLERIHRYKTGALINASVRLGALTAGAKASHTLSLLDQYAQNIGLAFQVQDDILDVTSNTATLGKRSGSDEKLNKSTYPALLGLTVAQQKARTLCEQAKITLNNLVAQGWDTSVLLALTDYIIQRDN